MFKYPENYDNEFRTWLSSGEKMSFRTFEDRLPPTKDGYPLPKKLNDRIVAKLFSHGGLLGSGLINIVNDEMGSGEYATPIDTNGREKKGAKVGRGGKIPDAQQITFDDIKVDPSKYTSGFYTVTYELAFDTVAFNEYLDSIMSGRVSDAINEDLSATLRSGVTQAEAVAKTGVKLAKLIEIKYETPKAYRSRDESRFVMNSDTLKAVIDGVTDEKELTKYVERSGTQTYIDGTLVHIDESMPNVDAVPGTGETIVPVVFADLSFLTYRNVPYVGVVRINNAWKTEIIDDPNKPCDPDDPDCVPEKIEIKLPFDCAKLALVTMGDTYFPVKDAGVGLPIAKAVYSVEPETQSVASDDEIITDDQILALTEEEKPAPKKRAPRKSKTTK